MPAGEAAPSAPSATVELRPGRLQRVPLFPAELAAPKSTVCVTGATGFIAGPIIERLLRAGHTVHATCRNPGNHKALDPLKKLQGAADRLRLFKADLTEPGSFDAAVQGCDYVIHVAAPVILTKIKPGEGRTKVVEPMLQGVDNLMGAVDRAPSVRRVVMTSSVSALCSFSLDRPRGARPAFGPEDWNDASAAFEAVMPYMYGKTVSERRAWDLAAGAAARCGRAWQLVTVLPSVVFGPMVGECGGSESVAAVRDLLWNGGYGLPAVGQMGVSAVDVRDVAAVHCLAMVTPGASGRYIAHAHDTNMYDCTHAVAARFPYYWPARFRLPYWLVWLAAPLVGLNRDVLRAMWGKPPRFDTSRTAADLGVTRWMGLGDTLEDMIRDMGAKGVIRLRG